MKWLSVDPGLTSTGVFYSEPGWTQSFTLTREKNEGRYRFMARVRADLVDRFKGQGIKIGLVEDYPYGMQGNMMAAAAEAGGVVRCAIAEIGVPFVAISSSLWQMVTRWRGMKKNTLEQKFQYCMRAEREFRCEGLATPDVVDAFLMYVTATRVLERDYPSPGAVKLKAKLKTIIEGGALLDEE